MKKSIFITIFFLSVINTFSFFTFSSCKEKEISLIKSSALGELHSYYIFREESSAIYFHSNRERKKIADFRPPHYNDYYRVYTKKQLEGQPFIEIDDTKGDIEESYYNGSFVRRKTGISALGLAIFLKYNVGDFGWEVKKNPSNVQSSYCWDQNNNDYYFIYSNKYNAYTFYVGEDKLVEKALLSLKEKKNHYLISYYTVNIYERSYIIQERSAEVPKSDILLIEYAK